jgi:hypothetical protein
MYLMQKIKGRMQLLRRVLYRASAAAKHVKQLSR